jgi:uncharacterized protein
VVDRADVLSPATQQQLESRLAAYERETSHQIVVHTTPSLEGLTIEQYSIRVAEAWKAGHKGLDNGLILTVAPDERKVRIEVGYGLEGVVPDAVASRIIRETILPAFRRGDLEAGILAGVDRLERAAAGEAIPAERRPARRRPVSGGGASVWLWILILLAFGLRGLFFAPFLGGMGRRAGYMGPRHRGGFGGGFGGGGGFSGGGGGFGGGGASGGW